MPNSKYLQSLEPIKVTEAVSAVFVALLETGEVRIGSGKKVGYRLKDIQDELGLSEVPKLIAGWPGGKDTELKVHERFVGDLSRTEGPLSRELYRASDGIRDLVDDVRALGFGEYDFRQGIEEPISTAFTFSNGKRLNLDISYVQVTQEGIPYPSHVLSRTCEACGERRNSLEFLNEYHLEVIRKKDYVFVDSGDTCRSCKDVVLPANVAFQGNLTYIRVGTLKDAHDRQVRLFDRKSSIWLEPRDLGIRAMAKKARESHANDLTTLRFQPYVDRK